MHNFYTLNECPIRPSSVYTSQKSGQLKSLVGAEFGAEDPLISHCELDYTETKRVKSNLSYSRRRSSWYMNFTPSYHNKLEQFRRVFKDSGVDTDRLLVDYSCAFYNNGILNQGRMFITEEWICFYSKLIYEFKLVMDVRKILSITKEKTAKFIPNAIQFTYAEGSDNTRYFFSSFTARERTFAILQKIWENGKSHQSMSMDEIIHQVRNMYGDHSVDTLISPSSSANLERSLLNASSLSSDTKNPRILEVNDVDVEYTQSCTNEHYSPRRSTWIELETAETENLSDRPCSLMDFRNNSKSIHRKISSPQQFNTRARVLAEQGNVSDGLINEGSFAKISSHGIILNKPDFLSSSPTNAFPSKKVSSISNNPRSLLDESDTTEDSDYSEIVPKTMVADPMQISGPMVCQHGHEGRCYLDAEFSIGIDALFRCIFTDCQFGQDFLDLRATTDYKADSWPIMPWDMQSVLIKDKLVFKQENPTRNISYVVALKQKVGPRSCLTIEKQTVVKDLSIPHRRYIVDTRINNENVPLCTSFHVECRYCLLAINKHTTRLRVHSRIVYDEKVFFAIKNIIESTCRTNTAESFNDMADLLKQHLGRLTRSEQLSGGSLVKPPALKNKNIEAKRTSSKSPFLQPKQDSLTISTGSLKREESSKQSKIFQIPRSDRDWLIIIAISILLCLCLSMLYSRFQQLEEMAAQFNTEYHPAGSCERKNLEISLELQKMRNIIDSLGSVLEEIRHLIKASEKRFYAIKDYEDIG